MSNPSLSIIIPTYNRPHLLPRAVQSVLAQTVEDLEVVVVDDGSPEPVKLPEHPRLRVVRLPENRGTAAARNAGAASARGRWITYLDDDDQLLPHMAEVSLAALANTTLPKPVAVLSALEVVNQEGKVTQTRRPPTLPRGKHFFLEEIEPGQSFLSKQTLVVERELILEIGGYDESFSSRVHTEIFLRLNPVCSILGVPTVTYQLISHEGPRISRDPSRRQVSFHQLVRKHKSLFKAHPKMFADFVYKHALMSYELGQKSAALSSVLWAMRIHPRHILGKVTWPLRKSLRGYTMQVGQAPSKSN
jgi:glycosyltransferase involved in cell wall biosynthesis